LIQRPDGGILLRPPEPTPGDNVADYCAVIPKAEMIADAIKQGFNAEAAAADPYSVLSWVEAQALAEFDAWPAGQQAEWVAVHGDPRKPLMWPSDAPSAVRDHFRRSLSWWLRQLS
jgi:hypothetical protein